MTNVLKGAQGSTATAATVRGYMKNSNSVDHAVMYPSSRVTSKNLPVGGNMGIKTGIAAGREQMQGPRTAGHAKRMGGE